MIISKSSIAEPEHVAAAIIVPAFIECATLVQVAESIILQPFCAEIVIVDDGSTDGTAERVEELSAYGGKIAKRYHFHNCGKTAAIRTGLAAVTAPYVLIQDADLEYDPNDYRRLFDCMSENDAQVVYGSRFLAAQFSFCNFCGHQLVGGYEGTMLR